MGEIDRLAGVFDGGLGVMGLAAVILIVVAALVGLLRLISGKRTFPYGAQGQLFTPAERAFLSALEQATAGRLKISGKVRVADVLRVEKGLMSQKRWWRAFTKISSKHVDFVLFDPHTTNIIAAIELDDRSHDKRQRRKRDIFLDRAFEVAGVPLLRFKTARRYDRATIQAKLAPLTPAAQDVAA